MPIVNNCPMWIIPTLSRPKSVSDLLKQASALDKSQGIVFVNGLEHVDAYKSLVLPPGWKTHFRESNIGALGAMNWMLKEYPNEKFYGFIGDDEFVYSNNWNTCLTEAAGDWNISHANDGWQSTQRIHSYVCIGGELARAVGYLAIPGCWHWFGFDTMWETIAQHIPIQKFVQNIETEHRHFLLHKVAKDPCYTLGESKMQEDEKVFSEWSKHKLPQVLGKIRNARP